MLVNSAPLVREKFNRPFTISDARKVCWVIFFKHRGQPVVVAHVLGQHLRIAGDYGERRIHLVRYARSQQPYGRQLLCLGELRFELHAVR